MVKKVLLVAFASLTLSLAAPVPAKEDLLPTEVHHRQPRPFFTFDNSVPGTHYPGQTQGAPKIDALFPGNYLPYAVLLPNIPFISGSGLFNNRNLIPLFNQTNAATKATLGIYLFNPLARSVDDSSLDVGSVSEVPSLTIQQLNELQQMYNQQLTSVGQGITYNTPNLLPTSLYSPSVQGFPYNTSPYLSQFNQYNPFAVPNYNAMFAPSGVLTSQLPGQESAVGAMFAPSGALTSQLPGQESAVSGLRFGITAPIPEAKTKDLGKTEGSEA